MKRKKQAGSCLFLMELILVLFFFLLTSAEILVCTGTEKREDCKGEKTKGNKNQKQSGRSGCQKRAGSLFFHEPASFRTVCGM